MGGKGAKGSRGKYDAEFKREAVKLSESEGYTVDRAAASLGIHAGLLSKWRRSAKAEGSDAFRGNGHRTAEAERIRQLEKENRELRMERDILKKASAYFAANQR
jgi:transposase